MGERMLIPSGLPKLIVECENLHTLMAVAKVINESGMGAKVLMEYEVKKYGEKETKSEDVHDKGKCE